MGLVSQLLRLCLMILLLSQAYCRPGNRFHGHFTVRDHTGSLGVEQQPPPPPPPPVSAPPPPSLAPGIPDDGPEGRFVDQPRRSPPPQLQQPPPPPPPPVSAPPPPSLAPGIPDDGPEGRFVDQPRRSPPPPMAQDSIRN